MIVLILLLPIVTGASVTPYREEYLLTVTGTVTEGEPVNYLHSEHFYAKGKLLRLVLRLWANQRVHGTIEVVRIVGYFVRPGRQGEASEVRIFGMYPQKVMNRTEWDFGSEYSRTLYASLEAVPTGMLGKVPVGLEIEIFLEAPNSSSNPTFLVYWEITVYGVY